MPPSPEGRSAGIARCGHTARWADGGIILEQGRMVFEGSAKEVIAEYQRRQYVVLEPPPATAESSRGISPVEVTAKVVPHGQTGTPDPGSIKRRFELRP